MQKFFVEEKQINNCITKITGTDVNHIANVLRLKLEDSIIICNKDSNISYNAKIKEITKKEITCKIESRVEETTEANVDITIYQGLPKAEKMEYIIQKTTELGVKQIVPVMMKRCIVKLNEKDAYKKIERWQKISEVAAKQSKRDYIPQIKNLVSIKDIETENYDIFLIAYEEEQNVNLKQELQKLKERIAVKTNKKVLKNSMEEKQLNSENEEKGKNFKIAVLVGPEGGVDRSEIEVLLSKGAKTITLGKRILRTETAPIAITSNIIYEFDLPLEKCSIDN